jgi:hypothetical protein
LDPLELKGATGAAVLACGHSGFAWGEAETALARSPQHVQLRQHGVTSWWRWQQQQELRPQFFIFWNNADSTQGFFTA